MPRPWYIKPRGWRSRADREGFMQLVRAKHEEALSKGRDDDGATRGNSDVSELPQKDSETEQRP